MFCLVSITFILLNGQFRAALCTAPMECGVKELEFRGGCLFPLLPGHSFDKENHTENKIICAQRCSVPLVKDLDYTERTIVDSYLSNTVNIYADLIVAFDMGWSPNLPKRFHIIPIHLTSRYLGLNIRYTGILCIREKEFTHQSCMNQHCGVGELEFRGACLFVVLPHELDRAIEPESVQSRVCAPRCSEFTKFIEPDERTIVDSYLHTINTGGALLILGFDARTQEGLLWDYVWFRNNSKTYIRWIHRKVDGAVCMHEKGMTRVNESCLYQPRLLYPGLLDSTTCETTCGVPVLYQGHEMCARHNGLGGGFVFNMSGRCHAIINFRYISWNSPRFECEDHGWGLEDKQFKLMFLENVASSVVHGIDAITSYTDFLPYSVIMVSGASMWRSLSYSSSKAHVWNRGHYSEKTDDELRWHMVSTVCSEVYFHWSPRRTKSGAVCGLGELDFRGACVFPVKLPKNRTIEPKKIQSSICAPRCSVRAFLFHVEL